MWRALVKEKKLIPDRTLESRYANKAWSLINKEIICWKIRRAFNSSPSTKKDNSWKINSRKCCSKQGIKDQIRQRQINREIEQDHWDKKIGANSNNKRKELRNW